MPLEYIPEKKGTTETLLEEPLKKKSWSILYDIMEASSKQLLKKLLKELVE